MKDESILEALKDLWDCKDVGVHFADERKRLRSVSYAELMERAQRFAGGLFRCGVKSGEPVILVMIEPESAIVAILGCMIAGCPPTPVYPPQNLRGVSGFLQFVKHVAAQSGASYVVAEAQPFSLLGGIPKETASVRGVERFGKVMQGERAELSTVNPVAFLQFTSGSTSVPKGVQVTHVGLSANLRMIREAAHMDRDSCVVTWLPVYHDMGLIGTVLNAITLPCELVVLPPIAFLKKPRLWLELMSEFRGTHTAAPNFAYGLSVKRVPDTGGLDLSSMTTFICGAEPVLPGTIETFVNHYESAGLHPGAMVPAYGLAEATLAVTFTPHMRGLVTEEVDVNLLSSGLAKTGGERRIRIASCGVPMNGLAVRIAAESGDCLEERMVGEIQIQGASVTPGYVGDEESTRVSRTQDGWLRTGDLGYLANGELYPCGRIKDVIIIRGKNFHAHDLENIASEVAGVRTGNVVAFSVREDSGESLVLVAETRMDDQTAEIARKIRTHLAESIGIAPDEVVVVPAGTLPKTSSGKLKRSETRRLYQQGTLTKKPGAFSAFRAAIDAFWK